MFAVIPVRDGVLPSGGLETIAECGGRVLLIGTGTREAALELGGRGKEVTIIEAGAFAPGAWAAALADHVADEQEIVLPASPDGRDLAPRLACALRRELFAGALSVTPKEIELVRHGGSIVTQIVPGGAFVATLQPGVRGVEVTINVAGPPVTALDYAAPTQSGQQQKPGSPSVADVRVLETLAPDAATMDLAESPRILSGGAGLNTTDSFDRLSQLARLLDASMGATRVITDRGWVAHERQIGTTGVLVDPALYLAFGISGAVQHTSGLGQPDHIISVNTDPHCPMMHMADLAIVSDANAVIAQLVERMADHD